VALPEINEIGPDNRKKLNEQSTSSAYSSANGETQQKAPPQPAPAPQKMEAPSLHQTKYRYKGIFVLPPHYIKAIEPVYEGSEDFTFKEVNYELTEQDINWVKTNLPELSLSDFELLIDSFEKIVRVQKNQSVAIIQQTF